MGLYVSLMVALGVVMGSVGLDGQTIQGRLEGSVMALETNGVSCSGELVQMTKWGGLGSLHCADGRSGSFNWNIVSPGTIHADGYLDGEFLEFTVSPMR